jgi:hypothetical protein
MGEFYDYFKTTINDKDTHYWHLCEAAIRTDIQGFAKIVANEIVKYRCQGAEKIHILWYNKAFLGEEHNKTPLIKPFIIPNVGTKDDPKPDDHLEGMIGEHLWYFLMQRIEHNDGPFIELEGPGLNITEGGGDGFALHKTSDGQHRFRLWELKKNSGESTVSSTIGTAYNQLKNRAPEYLAKISMKGGTISDPELKEIYANLVEMWLEGAPEASAGIHCVTCSSKKPRTCFSTFGDRFPELSSPKRLHGMLSTIDEFTAFAQQVREVLWKGL